MPLITLLTPTGFRKKAFALTESYVKRQTYKGDIQWLVSSDDKKEDPTPCTMGQEYHPCPLTWKPGINTQRYQFANLLPHIKGDYVFIWEDDDFYKPQYLEVMMDFLKHGDVVGESDVTYYNLARRGFKEMNNHRHASLCQTGFKRSYLPHFENAIHSGQTFFDLSLWGNARAKGHKALLFSGMNLLVGLKGIERSGIGFGHTASNDEFISDPNFIKLKQLLGIDANVYIEMFK